MGGSLRLPNSQPSDEDLRARRCSAIRTSSRCSFAMTASCASSLPTRPAATPAAYCAVMEIAIGGLTVVDETWREHADNSIALRMPRLRSQTVVNELRAMRIRNVGMLLNASPCQTLAP